MALLYFTVATVTCYAVILWFIAFPCNF